jgi:hypothetical protein
MGRAHPEKGQKLNASLGETQQWGDPNVGGLMVLWKA